MAALLRRRFSCSRYRTGRSRGWRKLTWKQRMFFTMCLLEDDDDFLLLCTDSDSEDEYAEENGARHHSTWVRPWIQERHDYDHMNTWSEISEKYPSKILDK